MLSLYFITFSIPPNLTVFSVLSSSVKRFTIVFDDCVVLDDVSLVSFVCPPVEQDTTAIKITVKISKSATIFFIF